MRAPQLVISLSESFATKIRQKYPLLPVDMCLLKPDSSGSHQPTGLEAPEPAPESQEARSGSRIRHSIVLPKGQYFLWLLVFGGQRR